MFALCASLQCNPSPWSFPNTWEVLVHGLPQRNLSKVQKFFPSYRMYLTPYTEISKPNIVGEFIVKSQSCFYRTINLLFKKKKSFYICMFQWETQMEHLHLNMELVCFIPTKNTDVALKQIKATHKVISLE